MKRATKLAIELRTARWGMVALAAVVIAGARMPVGARTSKGHAAKGGAVTGSAAEGKKLYEKESCSTCHKINNKGGKLGPDLSKEGTKKRSTPWLVALFKNPKSNNPKSTMPPVKSSQKQLQDLAAYMESLK